MILNLIVLFFVLGMAVLWSTYGLFSALIHLMLVLVAGSIALAVWEPVTVNLLLGAIPDYAWAVGLIGPFVVVLIVLRVALDKLIKGNMKFHPLVDQMLGGVTGAIAGVLTAGLTVIGLSYLPLPLTFLGYQPYEIKGAANFPGPSEGDDMVASLWIPVDRYAARTFGFLSTHGFASNRPLAHIIPDLREDAGTFRLGRGYDENSSLNAQPDTIEITEAQRFTEAIPQEVPAELAEFIAENAPTARGSQIVTVATTIKADKGTVIYDNDRILRMPPYQVQLRAAVDDSDTLASYQPVGWSKVPLTGTGRVFYSAQGAGTMASDTAPPADIVWVYAIPERAEPEYLQVRKVRLMLPDEFVTNDAERFVAALGQPFTEGDGDGEAQAAAPVVNPAASERVDAEVVGGYTAHKAVGLEQSDALPRGISPNDATGLTFVDGKVTGGKDVTSKSARGGVAVKSIFVPESLAGIRLQIAPAAAAQSTLGQAVGAGSNVAEIWIESSTGRKFYPLGYAWLRGEDRSIEVSVNDIRNTTSLPLNAYHEGDQLYLYFAIPPTVQLAKYHIGEPYQELHYTVEKNKKRK